MLTVPKITATNAVALSGGLRVLIADSQSTVVRQLALSLFCMPQVEVVEGAHTVKDFRRSVRRHRPNVVIVDLTLENSSCFDLLAEIERLGMEPEVIFHTDSNEQALKAFEISAADYILKPASFERLRNAVRRAEIRLWSRLASDRFCELQQRIHDLELRGDGAAAVYVQSLWFKSGQDLAQVAVDDVEWFEAAGDYVIAHTRERSHMLTESISGLETKLDPAQVIRVHRCSLVNISRIRSLRKRRPRGLSLVLNSGKQVVIGPKYEMNVLALMNAPRWR